MTPRLRKFLSYYVKYRRRFAAIMAAALLSALAALGIPMCIRHATSLALTGAAAGQELLRTGGVMLVLILLHLLFEFVYDYFGHALGARMESDLRSELFAHLESMSFSFYDRHKVGHLMSSLTNDLLDLTELFHHGPEDYVINGVRLIGASAVLLTIHPGMALTVLAVVLVMIVSTVLWGRRLRRISAENQARIADINSEAQDVLSGIRTVKAFAQEAAQSERFDRAGEAFYRSRKAVYRNESYADKTIIGLTHLSTLAVVVYGGIAMMRGDLDMGGLVAFLMYVGYLTGPVQKLSWMITQYQTGMAGFDRVMALLETEPEIKDAPDALDVPALRGEIEFRDVEFGYPDGSRVLCGMDLRIPAGQFAALVGMSGAGKSTLSALLPRFYDVQRGAIEIDGTDIRRYQLNGLRSGIAWVQQETYLFDGTIEENIRMGRPDATDAEVREAARLADADGFILQLPDGYRSSVGERGVRLSGGQRQRIGIARALLKNAPILVLDEATSALDNLSEARIFRALRTSRAGRTTIVIAHRLSTVRDASRIIVLRDGAVREDGDHESLMAADGAYAELYRRQNSGGNI